jgi:hypothetical protein
LRRARLSTPRHLPKRQDTNLCSAAAPWLSGEAELQQPCQIVEILLDRYQSPSRADDCHSVNSVSAGDWQILKEEPSRGPKYKGDRASERIAPLVFQPIRPTTKRNMHRALMPPWHRCQSLRTATIRFDIMPDQNIRFVHTKGGPPRTQDSRMASSPTTLGAVPTKRRCSAMPIIAVVQRRCGCSG